VTLVPARYDCIFVPQGAEFAAVRRGLRSIPEADRPPIVAIPAGRLPVERFLREFLSHAAAPPARPLLLGLCGSVAPGLRVGTAVAYRSLRDRADPQALHLLDVPGVPAFPEIPSVDGLNVDRVIADVAVKQAIAQAFEVVAIDMESAAVVRYFPQATIVRVVSDDLTGSVPDLSDAFDDRGDLKPIALAKAFVRQPRAALHLIRGSLAALACLSTLARTIADWQTFDGLPR